jgi:hypothetical protein
MMVQESQTFCSLWNKQGKYFKYSKIPLIQTVWNQAGAELQNILKYETLHTLTYIHTGIFLLLLLNLGRKTRGVFHLDFSLSDVSGSSVPSSVFRNSPQLKKTDEVGDKMVRRYHNGMVDTYSGRHFWTHPSDLLVFTDEDFFWQNKQNVQSWDYAPHVPDYQDFCISISQIKGMLLYFIITFITLPLTW